MYIILYIYCGRGWVKIRVWIGLDRLRFGMDRGYGSACGFRVWIGALHFDS